jgi:hypothetical protein
LEVVLSSGGFTVDVLQIRKLRLKSELLPWPGLRGTEDSDADDRKAGKFRAWGDG